MRGWGILAVSDSFQRVGVEEKGDEGVGVCEGGVREGGVREGGSRREGETRRAMLTNA